jgi:large subunit ribosomal protein L22
MAKEKRKLNDNQASATVRNIKTSVQKLNLVAGVIRNMKASDAVLQLKFMPKKVAHTVRQCLESALSNAENNHELDVDNLVVDKVLVGKAFVMKRFSARARGRGARILKPFSNLRIIVKEIEG